VGRTRDRDRGTNVRLQILAVWRAYSDDSLAFVVGLCSTGVSTDGCVSQLVWGSQNVVVIGHETSRGSRVTSIAACVLVWRVAQGIRAAIVSLGRF